MQRPVGHVPACGVRVAPTLGVCVVIDPGRDERVRRRRVARDTWCVGLAFLLLLVAVVGAPGFVVSGHAWVPVALAAGAVVVHRLRPPRRTIPGWIVDDLTWLGRVDAAERGLAHRQVWAAVTEERAVR